MQKKWRVVAIVAAIAAIALSVFVAHVHVKTMDEAEEVVLLQVLNAAAFANYGEEPYETLPAMGIVQSELILEMDDLSGASTECLYCWGRLYYLGAPNGESLLWAGVILTTCMLFAWMFYERSRKPMRTHEMVFISLMSALYVVLNVISPESAVMRISMLCFLPIAVTGMILGPVGGMLVAVQGDLLSCLVKGYVPYIPLTVVAALAGLWYGFTLHEKKVDWKRALLCVIPVVVVCEMCLNTVALSMLRHQPLWSVFVQRVWENLIEIPVKTLLLMAVIPAVRRIPKKYLNI